MTSVEQTDMVMMLKMRKRWVSPQGTASDVNFEPFSLPRGSLTVSEIPQVYELITPLGDDSYGVFDKCDNDEESSDRREVPTNLR